MKTLLMFLLLLSSCAKETSCEGCYIPRSIPNPLIINIDIAFGDESKVRKVYQEVKTKKWPGHYHIYDSILLTGSHLYNRMYDMKNYLNLSDYKIGDTFYLRTEIRWRFEPATFVNEDTLVY